MPKIHGVIPAIVTPMNPDESINEDELRNQIRRQIAAGVHGLFVFGTNGEFYALSEREKLRILEITVEENDGRLPVYAGTGCPTTADTIRLSKECEKIGADVLSVITPYFAACSQKELITHYEALAASVGIPIVLYNIPMRTNIAITPDTAARLAKIPGIAGIKDSSGSFDNILQYIERTADAGFTVMSGNDSLLLWTLQAGGKGGVCGIANLFPETMVSIYELWKRGDFSAAKKAQDSIRAVRNCFSLGNPNSIVKMAANLLGYPVGPCRKPFWSEDPTVIEKLDRVIKENYLGVR